MSFPRHIILIISYLSITNYCNAQENSGTLNGLVQCSVPIYPHLSDEPVAENPKAITILAEKSAINKDKMAKFVGNVMLLKDQQVILANEVELNRETSTLDAQGDIHFQNSGVDIFAEKLNISEGTSKSNLAKAKQNLKKILLEKEVRLKHG